MNWKVNRFGWLTWGIFAAAALYFLYGTAEKMAELPGFSGKGMTYGITGGVLLLAGLLNVCVRMISRKRVNPVDWNASVWKILEGILLVAFTVAGVLIRMQSMPTVDGGVYFQAAMMKAGESVPVSVHGAEYLYVQLLHGVCYVLGNNLTFCVWLHTVLQILAGLLCYAGIRKLSGGVSALFFSGFYMLVPQLFSSADVLGAQPLFFCFFGMGLYAVACFIKKAEGSFAGYLVAALVTAFVIYLDLAGVALLVAGATVLYAERDDAEHAWNKSGISYVIYFAGTAAFLAAYSGLDSWLSQRPFGNVVRAWGNLYQPGKTGVFSLWTMESMEETVASLLLAFCLTVGIGSYFSRKLQERLSVLVLAAVSVTLTGLAGMNTGIIPAADIVKLFLLSMAGVSFVHFTAESERTKPEKLILKAQTRSIWDDEEEEIPEEQITEEQIPVEKIPEEEIFEEKISEEQPVVNSTERETVSDDAVHGNLFVRILENRRRKKEERRLEAEKVLNALSSLSEGGTSLVNDTEKMLKKETEVPEQKKAVRGKPLENPLPVPKKPVLNPLDYDYDVSDDDDYDYD